jgi:hypothetical protein
MAITSNDLVVAGMFGRRRNYQKVSATSEGAGTWHSLWRIGNNPAAGSDPPLITAGAGYVPTNLTAGAFPFTNPVAGKLSYLARASAIGVTAGTLIVYDRVWACSGFVTNVTTVQNITTPGAITARDILGAVNGDDVELWGEVYTAPGATGATWSVSYTNSQGVSGRTATYTHPANAESTNQMFPFNLQAGDSGVRAVASLTCSVSSGTAGNIGLTLVRRVAEIPITLANAMSLPLGPYDLGDYIYNDSCLAFMVQCTATNTGFIHGGLTIAQG